MNAEELRERLRRADEQDMYDYDGTPASAYRDIAERAIEAREAAEARVAALEGVMERVADARLADVLLAFDGAPFAWAQTELAAALAGERGASDA